MKLPTPNNDNSPRPATVFLFMAQYRQCALEDGERREKWLAKAEKWNQRAGAVLGHPELANYSESPSKDKKKH